MFQQLRSPISVVVCNPRLFREITEVLNKLKVSYTVPRELPVVMEGIEGDVIADEECKAYVKGTKRVFIVHEDNLLKVALSIDGRKARTLHIGLDIGARIAYVALIDDLLAEWGYVDSSRALIYRMRSLVKSLSPEKVIVKVGAPGRKMPRSIIRISRLMKNEGYDTYIVNEVKSNQALAIIKSVFPEAAQAGKDIVAALNIALREGERLTDYSRGI